MGFAGAAYAGSATAPKAMSDSEMDAVTAAGGPPTNPGEGVLTACDVRGFSVCSVKVIDNPQGIKEVGVGRCSSGRCASDIRLKRDIKQVARLDNGLALYRYRYKWSDQVYVGVMAQEVLLVRPDAVVRGADGYLRVDYSRLGLCGRNGWPQGHSSQRGTARQPRRRP